MIDGHDHLLLTHGRQAGGTKPLPSIAIDCLCQNMREGGVSAVGLIVGGNVSFPRIDLDSPWWGTLDGLERFWQGCDKAECDLLVIADAQDIDKITEETQAVLLGIEGAEPCFDTPLTDSLAALRLLAHLGVRSFQLVGNPKGPAFEPQSADAGTLQLSQEGRSLIQEASRLGMVIDLAHLSGDEPAFREIISLSISAPITSHHSCRALSRLPEALSDEAIKHIARAGGVVGIHSGSHWLTGTTEQATVDDMVRHIRYVCDLVGVDHVAVGTDHIDLQVVPMELPDTLFMADFDGPQDLRRIEDALVDAGFDAVEKRKILSDNVLRVWRNALAVRSKTK